jgi:hypothetical protein
VSTASTPALTQVGVSGKLTILGQPITTTIGDIVVANDAPAYYRPGTARSRFEMTGGTTATIQMFINAVAGFRLNGVRPPLPDGTYPCYIDPLMEAQLFTDPAFQILTQGDEKSSSFKNARVAMKDHLPAQQRLRGRSAVRASRMFAPSKTSRWSTGYRSTASVRSCRRAGSTSVGSLYPRMRPSPRRSSPRLPLRVTNVQQYSKSRPRSNSRRGLTTPSSFGVYS